MFDMAIREICGDYALDLKYPDKTIVIYFNSYQNALNVKRIIEIDRSVPNTATVADFVEVVRCKECVHYRKAEDWKGDVHMCCYLRADICLFERKSNDFCSYGESINKNSLPEGIKQSVLDSFMKGSDS